MCCRLLPPITYLCRYNSEHNQRAKSYLLQHLSDKFSATYFPRKSSVSSSSLPSSLSMAHVSANIHTHLSAGYMLCVVLCTQVLSRCRIFRQYPVKMSHLLAGYMLCVVLCTQVLSRCLIFRQYPVKMAHLLAGYMCCVTYPSAVNFFMLSCNIPGSTLK